MDRIRFTHTTLALIAAAGMVVSTGCGETVPDDSTGTATQQLTGDISSDADANSDVIAIDEAGTSYLFETDADGNFQLELPVDHTYELYVSPEGMQGLDEANKMVFPRTDEEIDQKIKIGGEMAPFDLGEVGSADSLETANYQVEQTEDRRSSGDATDESDDAEGIECDEGAPGLFCIHDGIHPGCEGLSIAADKAGAADDNAAEAPAGADEGPEIAQQARQAAEQEAADTDAASAVPESSEEERSMDAERPVALPQFNPPAKFPGCSDE